MFPNLLGNLGVLDMRFKCWRPTHLPEKAKTLICWFHLAGPFRYPAEGLSPGSLYPGGSIPKFANY